MKRIWLWLLFACALAGALLSAYTVHDYYALTSHRRVAASYCNINAYVNCDAVTLSRYAAWGGIPNGVFGGAFFLFLFASALRGLLAREKEEDLADAVFGLSLLGALGCVVLFALATFAVRALCLNCLAAYALTGLCLWSGRMLSRRSWGAALPALPAALARTLGTWFSQAPRGAAAAVPLTTLLALFALQLFLAQRWSGMREGAAPGGTGERVRAGAIDVSDSPRRGPAGAPVTIVVFSDFLCPACRSGAQALKAAIEPYAGQVRLYFKHFPLDMACNPVIRRPFHDGACRLAYAAACADAQGRFWDYHDRLFEGGVRPDVEALEGLAQDLGLTAEAFARCMLSDGPERAVRRQIEQGIQLGVQATPTVIVNGRAFEGMPTPEALRRAIEEALNASR